jgi:hypothetical protein
MESRKTTMTIGKHEVEILETELEQRDLVDTPTLPIVPNAFLKTPRAARLPMVFPIAKSDVAATNNIKLIITLKNFTLPLVVVIKFTELPSETPIQRNE